MTDRYANRAPYVPNARRVAQAVEDARFGRRGTEKPMPGLYAWRFVKGAVEVGAEIRYAPTPDPDFPDNPQDRSPLWWANVNGQEDPEPQPTPSETVWSIYVFGRRIDRAEYQFLLADREWAREHAPHRPEANPTKPVDLRTMDPRLLL